LFYLRSLLESEFIPQIIKILPLGFTMGGLLLAFLVNQARSFSPSKDFEKFSTSKSLRINCYKVKISRLGVLLYYMLNKRWFFDKVYNTFLSGKLLYFGYIISFKKLDKGCFEIIGPYGISLLFSKVTRQISRLQSGMIYHYAVMMLVGLILFITTVGLWDSLEDFVDNRLYFVLFAGYVVLGTLNDKTYNYN
jgi:NADH:ubiquinone oxidoreductase subunit 5 (subunit L)/multisubunit Na+/H+ antiporter MnhA subunit